MMEILLHPAVTATLIADTRDFKKLALAQLDEADLAIQQIAIHVTPRSWQQVLTTCRTVRACIVTFDPLSPEAARQLDVITNFFAAVDKLSTALRRISMARSSQTAA